MNLELGQRIYDKDRETAGVIALRFVNGNYQFLEAHADNEELIARRGWVDDELERMFVADDGEICYTWTEDPDVEELND